MKTNILKTILNKVTNGILLLVIGILHTKLALSGDFGKEHFYNFSKSYFFKISEGLNDLPISKSKIYFEPLFVFWFFYFGVLLIPLGLLVHHIEKNKGILPYSFTISYLIFVSMGCYMIPMSGMTFLMLPQAIYMLISNHLKKKSH